MTKSMRIMTESPLNAETPAVRLRSWITPNAVFFDRNQGKIPEVPVALDKWALTVDGMVKKKLGLHLDQIQRLPKAIVANSTVFFIANSTLYQTGAILQPSIMIQI